ncbi:GPI ethanolamine phosphate transferase 2, partial [Stegodyphus mimosarum]
MNFFRNRCTYLLFCFILYLVGFTLFLFGFTSTKVGKIQPVSKNFSLPNCFSVADENVCLYQEKAFKSLYSRHYEKFVLIIIDALRADFIPSVSLSSEHNVELPFTDSLIRNGSALSFINTVFSPTVTLPRIKTLVSGSVSNFMDVLINFNASKVYDDNFLLQATLHNLKAVFYGDDTWLKLFPGLFIRSEGIHSFFVSDFTEVDTNVTRHLTDELSKEDWNVMILHYLGVDHIGHAFGPNSEYLAPKLKEMDNVIKHIYEKLKHKSKIPSLVIICGDHGMTSSGSHGGVTKNELLTPLVFINTNCSKCLNPSTIKTVSQVDFAVTLSILMGIPIPVNSVGSIIPEVLHFSDLTPQQVLNAAFYNLLQLLKVYEHLFPSERNIHYEDIKNIIWQ